MPAIRVARDTYEALDAALRRDGRVTAPALEGVLANVFGQGQVQELAYDAIWWFAAKHRASIDPEGAKLLAGYMGAPFVQGALPQIELVDRSPPTIAPRRRRRLPVPELRPKHAQLATYQWQT